MMLLYRMITLIEFLVEVQICTQLFLFCGGGDDRVLVMQGCCNAAHAKRILHTKYPNNMSRAMVFSISKIQ